MDLVLAGVAQEAISLLFKKIKEKYAKIREKWIKKTEIV
jgi:hypothetical protein